MSRSDKADAGGAEATAAAVERSAALGAKVLDALSIPDAVDAARARAVGAAAASTYFLRIAALGADVSEQVKAYLQGQDLPEAVDVERGIVGTVCHINENVTEPAHNMNDLLMGLTRYAVQTIRGEAKMSKGGPSRSRWMQEQAERINALAGIVRGAEPEREVTNPPNVQPVWVMPVGTGRPVAEVPSRRSNRVAGSVRKGGEVLRYADLTVGDVLEGLMVMATLYETEMMAIRAHLNGENPSAGHARVLRRALGVIHGLYDSYMSSLGGVQKDGLAVRCGYSIARMFLGADGQALSLERAAYRAANELGVNIKAANNSFLDLSRRVLAFKLKGDPLASDEVKRAIIFIRSQKATADTKS